MKNNLNEIMEVIEKQKENIALLKENKILANSDILAKLQTESDLKFVATKSIFTFTDNYRYINLLEEAMGEIELFYKTFSILKSQSPQALYEKQLEVLGIIYRSNEYLETSINISILALHKIEKDDKELRELFLENIENSKKLKKMLNILFHKIIKEYRIPMQLF